VASHLAGLAFARYQLKIEPLASAAIDDLVAWLGPTVQRYLTD
jgi:Tetracyclin repressor-like, C-terminal domain